MRHTSSNRQLKTTEINDNSEFLSALESKYGDKTTVGERIKEVLPPKLSRKLALFAECLSEGLNWEDACEYTRLERQDLDDLINRFPVVHEFIRHQEVKLKRKLLKPIIEKGEQDEKVSLWFLEKKYPEEFNQRKGAANDEAQQKKDLIALALASVQNSAKNKLVDDDGEDKQKEVEAKVKEEGTKKKNQNYQVIDKSPKEALQAKFEAYGS